MKIVLDARAAADHFPGIGRYVAGLLGGLAEVGHPHELIALTSGALPNTRHDLARLGARLVEAPGSPFSPATQLRTPALLRALRADLFHAPYYVRPYWAPCPSVTTLYDIIPLRLPGTATPRARLLFGLLHRLAIGSSRQLIAISQHARAELCAAFAIDPRRISVTPLAAGPRFSPRPPAEAAALRERAGLPARYALTLGSDQPHKNLAGLLRAWAECARAGPLPALAIAGHPARGMRAAQALIDELGLAEGVRLLPAVPEADLPALYSGAELFIYPSLYEGFGLPPLEALACGAPVICGANTSLPEVVGEAALTADVADPAALAAAIARALGDPALRARLAAAGPPQAARFSWAATAQLTLEVYERAARQR